MDPFCAVVKGAKELISQQLLLFMHRLESTPTMRFLRSGVRLPRFHPALPTIQRLLSSQASSSTSKSRILVSIQRRPSPSPSPFPWASLFPFPLSFFPVTLGHVTEKSSQSLLIGAGARGAVELGSIRVPSTISSDWERHPRHMRRP